jgi:DNA-directed RNA polymerase subunit RPC12/RpoP
MKITVILGALASAVLLFFGFIFLLSAGSVNLTGEPLLRLVEAAILLIVGFALAYVAYAVSRKPTTIIQQLELSGEMKAAPIKCPNCGGSVDPKAIKIVSGVPYATCPYCGKTFEVAEEPKW